MRCLDRHGWRVIINKVSSRETEKRRPGTQMNEILKDFCCQNEKCPQYGVLGRGNIRARAQYGPGGIRLLYCRKCGDTFSERRGTILSNSRLAPEKVIGILRHLAEDKSQRWIAHELKVDRGAVSHVAKQVGERAKEHHDELVALSEQARIQRETKLDPKRKLGDSVQAATELLGRLFSENAHGDNRVEKTVRYLAGCLPHAKRLGRIKRLFLDRVLKEIPGVRYTYSYGERKYTFEELKPLRLHRRYCDVTVTFEYTGSPNTLSVPVALNSEK